MAYFGQSPFIPDDEEEDDEDQLNPSPTSKDLPSAVPSAPVAPVAASNTPDESEDESSPDTTPTAPTAQGANTASRFGDLYNTITSVDKPGPATKAYRDYLDQGALDKSDYKPGKLNRLAAILGGTSTGYFQGAGKGIQVAQDTLDRPYDEAVRQNELMGKRLEAGSNIEQRDLGRRVQLVNDVMKNDVERDKAKTQADKVASENAKRDAEIKRIQKIAAVAGWKPITDKNTGKLLYTRINPDTQQVETMDGSKIDLSTAEKRKEALDLFRGKTSITAGKEKELEDVRQNNRLDLEKTKETFETGRDKTRAQTAKDLITARANANPNSVYVQHENQKQKFFDSWGNKPIDPNDASKGTYASFFTKDARGHLVFNPPPDADENAYKAVVKYIYGGGQGKDEK